MFRSGFDTHLTLQNFEMNAMVVVCICKYKIKYNSYTSVNINIHDQLKTNTDQLYYIDLIDVAATAAMQARSPGEAEPRTPAARAGTVSRWRKGRGGR